MGRPKGSKTNPFKTPLPFKQSEIERAIRSVQARDLPIHHIEIDPVTRRISIFTVSAASVGGEKNPWDEDEDASDAKNKKQDVTNAKNKKRVA